MDAIDCRHLCPGSTCGAFQRPVGVWECVACGRYERHRPALVLGPSPMRQLLGPERPTIVNRRGQPVELKDLWLGARIFWVCGGPSLRQLDLSLLSRRGVAVAAMNNSVGALPPGVRPVIWLHSDPCRKFHRDIWRDPGILKFAPRTLWKAGQDRSGCLWRRNAAGELEQDQTLSADQCPGALAYERNHTFDPPTFLGEPTCCNGVSRDRESFGTWPHVINTFFVGLKLLYWLGFRTVYLLGTDFRMDPAVPYAVDQGKSAGAARANNSAFAKIMAMCDELVPHFQRAGYAVWNCSPGSFLWSFPRKEYLAAVEEASGDFEQVLNSRGYYDVKV